MEYPRAHLYQATIQQYFVRVARPANPSGPYAASAQSTNTPSVFESYRRFVRGAGTTQDLAINVDEWSAQRPFDVDGDGGISAANTCPSAPVEVAVPDVGPGLPAVSRASNDSTTGPSSVGSVRHGSEGVAGEATEPNAKPLFTCSICADTFNRPVVTLCMHVFCDSCISRNLSYSRLCPLCRTSIRDAPLRDAMFEQELAQAISRDGVHGPTVPGRSIPYTWPAALFPPAQLYLS
ncbi:hypothetical protein B0H13DRAFT_2383935 [Mycena leptocephala]|nr:hypothetical protein B0H13DRAFT_2383935 [Mycena leptocephala]